MLLKKAKMNRSKFLPLRPSKPDFRNPTHHSELTKAAGWKSDCLYVPLHHFRTTAPVPLKKSVRPPKKHFSTVSVKLCLADYWPARQPYPSQRTRTLTVSA